MGREATAPVTGPRAGEVSFDEVFVARRVGSTDKCLVSDRAGVTQRRSEPDPAASRWRCVWPQGRGGALFALDGKRPNWLFVPYEQVREPLAPWLWSVGRAASAADADRLPPLDWVQLFVDRRYRGLHLRVRLPAKRFAARRDLGRVEMLSLDASRLEPSNSGPSTPTVRCWNRKLAPSCTLWSGAFVAESLLPQPAWTDATIWLADRLVGDRGSLAFTLAELPPEAAASATDAVRSEALHPWPLPFDLSALLAPLAGATPDASTAGRAAAWRDQRYASWRPSSGPETLSLAGRFAAAGSDGQTDVKGALDRLETALRAHCAVRECDASAEAARLRAPRPALQDFEALAAGGGA